MIEYSKINCGSQPTSSQCGDLTSNVKNDIKPCQTNSYYINWDDGIPYCW